jgi:sRNA-binding protein
MTPTSSAAAATERTVTDGRIGGHRERLTDTKSYLAPSSIIGVLAELFPVFVAEPWQPHKPLAIGIDKQLLATGILKPFEVGQVLRAYCRRRMYQVALAAGGPRFNLAGNVAGEVTPEQQACAKASLAAMDAKAAETATKVRTEQKAAYLAEKAKRAAVVTACEPKGPRPHHKTQPEICAAESPHVEPMPKPRLGLADLRRAFQERKAAQAAVQGGG